MVNINDIFYIKSRNQTVFTISYKDYKDHYKTGDTFVVDGIRYRINHLEVSENAFGPSLIGIVVQGNHKQNLKSKLIKELVDNQTFNV